MKKYTVLNEVNPENKKGMFEQGELVISKYNDCVVMCTGEQRNDDFAGQIQDAGKGLSKKGFFLTTWNKYSFIPFNEYNISSDEIFKRGHYVVSKKSGNIVRCSGVIFNHLFGGQVQFTTGIDAKKEGDYSINWSKEDYTMYLGKLLHTSILV